MAKLVIKGFEPHPMSHCPEIPCYFVTVELQGSRILTTSVMITYDDAFSLDVTVDEPGRSFTWQYGHSVDPEFDEIDVTWKYRASESVLEYAKNTIEKHVSFKNWDRGEDHDEAMSDSERAAAAADYAYDEQRDWDMVHSK